MARRMAHRRIVGECPPDTENSSISRGEEDLITQMILLGGAVFAHRSNKNMYAGKTTVRDTESE